MDKKIEIYGIRSIIEAIESSKDISRVYLLKSNSHKSNLFKSLVSLLENNNIKYSFVPKEKFKKFENKNHQGAVAILSPIKLLSIEELLSVTYDKKSPKTYVLLDGITDARNFGAIIRTAVASDVVVGAGRSAFFPRKNAQGGVVSHCGSNLGAVVA